MSEAGEIGIPPQEFKAEIKPSQVPNKETGKNPNCLFISGAWGTHAGIRGVKEGLEQSYGAGKVESFNSIFSSDPQNPQRFEQMADIIQARAKEGLDIVAHSLGAVELRKAIEILRERDVAFFDNKENTDNLHIVLISPSGFAKNIAERFKFLGRALRFTREQADLGVISKRNTLFRGIDALTAFPPQNISSADLNEALREAMPELSQNKDDIEKVRLEQGQGYSPNLSEAQKKEVGDYSLLISATIKEKNYAGLRHLVVAYGEKFKGSVSQAYAGNFEATEAPILEATRASIGGYLGLLSALIESAGGKPMKEISNLRQKGVRTDFLVPEYDIYLPLNQVIEFFEGSPDSASSHVRVAEGVAHAYLGLRPKEFAKTVRSLRGDQTNV